MRTTSSRVKPQLSKCRPRTRGDAPRIDGTLQEGIQSAPHPRGCSADQAGRRPVEAVGPAPAGMLRDHPSASSSRERRPRTRGDAPATRSRNHSLRLSAPHPRGCSRVRARLDDRREVGPAPAGMLRSTGTSPRTSPSRPRTRGDAPATRGVRRALGESAPHPRGCSVRDERHPGGHEVGPAPAGMLRTSRYRTPSSTGSAPHPRGCSELR